MIRAASDHHFERVQSEREYIMVNHIHACEECLSVALDKVRIRYAVSVQLLYLMV